MPVSPSEPHEHVDKLREALSSRVKCSEEVADRILNLMKCEAIIEGETLSEEDEIAVYMYANLAVATLYNMLMEAHVFLIPSEKIVKPHVVPPPPPEMDEITEEEPDED
jgi:hypothetical protein